MKLREFRIQNLIKTNPALTKEKPDQFMRSEKPYLDSDFIRK